MSFLHSSLLNMTNAMWHKNPQLLCSHNRTIHFFNSRKIIISKFVMLTVYFHLSDDVKEENYCNDNIKNFSKVHYL